MIWKTAFLAVLVSSPAFADRLLEGRVTVVRDVDRIVVVGHHGPIKRARRAGDLEPGWPGGVSIHDPSGAG